MKNFSFLQDSFIYLAVLVLSCTSWNLHWRMHELLLVQHVGSSYLTSNWTQGPCTGHSVLATGPPAKSQNKEFLTRVLVFLSYVYYLYLDFSCWIVLGQLNSLQGTFSFVSLSYFLTWWRHLAAWSSQRGAPGIWVHWNEAIKSWVINKMKIYGGFSTQYLAIAILKDKKKKNFFFRLYASEQN